MAKQPRSGSIGDWMGTPSLSNEVPGISNNVLRAINKSVAKAKKKKRGSYNKALSSTEPQPKKRKCDKEEAD